MSNAFVRAALAALVLAGAPLVAFGQSTPAEQKIAAARKSIEADPSRHQPYAELALAFARRARETSDPAWYEQAQGALAKSFNLAPANLEAEHARIWVLLGKHEFAEALERAQALNQRLPDDLLGYAFLVDANTELGNYEAAEAAAQWLLDLRPGNVPGLTRAAYLNSNRELVFYYANHAAKPALALDVAQREVARRRDIHTLDAYAWALYRSGRYSEAEEQIALALEVGMREAGMLYRAGAIALEANDRSAAAMRLNHSLALAPRAATAASARLLLEQLQGGAAPSRDP